MKIRFSNLLISTLFFFFLASCGTANALPCPIPKERMAAPETGDAAFTVINNACITFCDVNIAPNKNCDDWGFDWLGTESLRSGESITVYLPPGMYDVNIEDCTDLSHILYKQKVEDGGVLDVQDFGADKNTRCSASVTVVNKQTIPICFIWIGAEHSDYFGGNWLGKTGQILPGESSQFFVFPGSYDLKAEGCDFEMLKLGLDTRIEDHITWTVE